MSGPVFQFDRVFGCTLVVSPVDKDGYGRIGDRRAHIVAWEEANGRLEPGIELDHRCRRRNCIAVHHLEPVSRGENERRKKWGRRAREEKCPRGHEMATNRVVIPETAGVVCRACNQEAKGTRA